MRAAVRPRRIERVTSPMGPRLFFVVARSDHESCVEQPSLMTEVNQAAIAAFAIGFLKPACSKSGMTLAFQ